MKSRDILRVHLECYLQPVKYLSPPEGKEHYYNPGEMIIRSTIVSSGITNPIVKRFTFRRREAQLFFCPYYSIGTFWYKTAGVGKTMKKLVRLCVKEYQRSGVCKTMKKAGVGKTMKKLVCLSVMEYQGSRCL